MATYIQGIQDYIPQPALFRPDYEFLTTVLETRQGTYDQNYKQLNSLYNTLRYGDLTREDTRARRDNFMNLADNEIKKATTLDLSLEQNVQAIKSVFNPFWDDKLLVTDLGKTRAYVKEMKDANFFRSSPIKEVREQYWDTGVKALNYQMEEFKMASPDDAINMGAGIQYVRSMNLAAMADKFYKEKGYNIVQGGIKGGYIVKTKNGETITPLVAQDLMMEFSSDPGVAAMFETQSYVAQKDFGVQNEGVFGDRISAELAWADVVINTMSPEVLRNSKKALDFQKELKEKIDHAEQKIRSTGMSASSSEADEYRNYLRQQAGLEPIVAKASEIADEVSRPINNEQEKLARARYIYGNQGMYQQISAIASSLANRDSSFEITGADPFAIENLRHNNTMIENAYKAWWDSEVDAAKKFLDPNYDPRMEPGQSGNPIMGEGESVVIGSSYNENVRTANSLYSQISSDDMGLINSFLASEINPTRKNGQPAITIKDKNGNVLGTYTSREFEAQVQKERSTGGGYSKTLNNAINSIAAYADTEAGKSAKFIYGDKQVTIADAIALREISLTGWRAANEANWENNGVVMEQVINNISGTPTNAEALAELQAWEKKNLVVAADGAIEYADPGARKTHETLKAAAGVGSKDLGLLPFANYFAPEVKGSGNRIMGKSVYLANILKDQGYTNEQIAAMQDGNFADRNAKNLWEDASDAYDALWKEFSAVYNSSTSSFNLQARLQGDQEMGGGAIYSESATFVYNQSMGSSRAFMTDLLSQINAQSNNAVFTVPKGSSQNDAAERFYRTILPKLLVGPATDPKKGGNALYSITYNKYNAAEGMGKYSSYTIRINDEALIKEYIGTQDNPGILWGQDDIRQNGVQINIPREEDNTVVAQAQNRIDPVLSMINSSSTHSTKLDNGAELTYGAGNFKLALPNAGFIQYSDIGGQYYFTGALKNFDDNNNLVMGQPVRSQIPFSDGRLADHYEQASILLRAHEKSMQEQLDKLERSAEDRVYNPTLLAE